MPSFQFPAFFCFLVCIFNCIHIRHVSSASSAATSIPFEEKGTVRCYVIPSAATPSPELKSVPVESSKSLPYSQSTKTTNGNGNGASHGLSSSYALPIILMAISASAVLIGVSYLLVNYALSKMRRRRRRRTSVLPLIARMPHAGSHVDTNNNVNIFESRLASHSIFMGSSREENGRSSHPADRQERRGDVNNNMFIATEEPPPSYDHLFSKSNQNQTN